MITAICIYAVGYIAFVWHALNHAYHDSRTVPGREIVFYCVLGLGWPTCLLLMMYRKYDRHTVLMRLANLCHQHISNRG